ncbi:hypothetical protein HHK36_013032 [Tetracentron sinense]|uniref:Plantacyanin n=1 Tax=Tetracentron sinense TaxID=13715 RepID=A0A834Z7U8_TETSI|nr:hypothetical protein HHK36_013032 [Tetracentron sinense]
MFCRGRCSANRAATVSTALLVSLLIHFQLSCATTFTVGDSSGWTFNVDSWTSAKTFKAGDILVFGYDPSVHNVVAVDSNGYNNCTASSVSTTYTSGNDRIKLVKGHSYFICSVPGHCDSGVKIAIDAS